MEVIRYTPGHRAAVQHDLRAEAIAKDTKVQEGKAQDLKDEDDLQHHAEMLTALHLLETMERKDREKARAKTKVNHQQDRARQDHQED